MGGRVGALLLLAVTALLKLYALLRGTMPEDVREFYGGSLAPLWALAIIELALAVGLASRWWKPAAHFSVVLFTGFGTYSLWRVAFGGSSSSAACGCLGGVDVPVWWGFLISCGALFMLGSIPPGPSPVNRTA